MYEIRNRNTETVTLKNYVYTESWLVPACNMIPGDFWNASACVHANCNQPDLRFMLQVILGIT